MNDPVIKLVALLSSAVYCLSPILADGKDVSAPAAPKKINSEVYEQKLKTLEAKYLRKVIDQSDDSLEKTLNAPLVLTPAAERAKIQAESGVNKSAGLRTKNAALPDPAVAVRKRAEPKVNQARELKELSAKISSLEQTIANQKKEAAQKQVALEQSEMKLATTKLMLKKENSAELKEQIIELELDLAAAEIEVERLATILNHQNSATLGLSSQQNAYLEKANEKSDSPVESDLPLVIVTAKKANLRSGPGTNNAPLMSVSKDSKLVVETRKGSWLRVIAPNGRRVWVSETVVRSIDGSGPAKDSAVSVSPVSKTAAAKAMGLWRKN